MDLKRESISPTIMTRSEVTARREKLLGHKERRGEKPKWKRKRMLSSLKTLKSEKK